MEKYTIIAMLKEHENKAKVIFITCTIKERREKGMNTIGTKNVNGELINLNQACEITNLGANTIRNLAAEAGAVRKIGKSYRIKKEILLNYIDKNFKVE